MQPSRSLRCDGWRGGKQGKVNGDYFSLMGERKYTLKHDTIYSKSEYMAIINQSLEEVKSGQFGVLKSEQEIDTFLDSL